jgi:hypothetical protein
MARGTNRCAIGQTRGAVLLFLLSVGLRQGCRGGRAEWKLGPLTNPATVLSCRGDACAWTLRLQLRGGRYRVCEPSVSATPVAAFVARVSAIVNVGRRRLGSSVFRV